MRTSLLSSLRKYSQQEKNDPLENFITEAFGWILKNNIDYAEYFINKLSLRASIELPYQRDGEWKTQCNFGGKFPDMVYFQGSNAIIFENKTWSSLHTNQLENYRKYAKINFSRSWLILITATKNQHSQSPDIALCWSDIYEIMSDWMSASKEVSFIFEDFLQLLKDEGMGPPAPISHESILYYFSAIKLENNVIELMRRVEKNGWIPTTDKNDFNSWLSEKKGSVFKKAWGRIGLNYLSWNPSVFFGVMLNGKDHCISMSNEDKGPDFCLILDFSKKHHDEYPRNEYYLKLIEILKSKIENLDDGWELYQHLEDNTVRSKNKWHPIHIRKPMLSVFSGTESSKQQEEIFCEIANKLINFVIEEEVFWFLRNILEKPL